MNSIDNRSVILCISKRFGGVGGSCQYSKMWKYSQGGFKNNTETPRYIPEVSRNYNPEDKPILSPLHSPSEPSSQRLLSRISSTHHLGQPLRLTNPPCQCGMATEATKLRLQNSQLKLQIERLIRQSSPQYDQSYQSKLEQYQQYLNNSETNNDALRRENSELRQQGQSSEGLRKRVQVVEEEKRVIEESLRAQMQQNMLITQQKSEEFYNGPAGLYVEELERNNQSLTKENRRLSGIIMERIRNTFV